MLLERLDRLEEESATLHDFQQRYHDVDKKAGILEERLRERQKRAIAQEILHGAGLVVGSMMVGYAPSLSDVQQLFGRIGRCHYGVRCHRVEGNNGVVHMRKVGMRVQIQSVVDKGDMDQERLVLKVRDDADIGDFMLVRTGFKDDDVTTKVVQLLLVPLQARPCP